MLNRLFNSLPNQNKEYILDYSVNRRAPLSFGVAHIENEGFIFKEFNNHNNEI